MSKERDEHQGRRDSEVLRDAEAIRAEPSRLKNAMRHLQFAKNAIDRSGGARELRGKKRRGARENPRA